MKNDIAKPFLKWAGGKTQLLEDINDRLDMQTKIGVLVKLHFYN